MTTDKTQMKLQYSVKSLSCRAKLQSNHHHQQTNIRFFTGWMPFLSPNQQCQSTEGKNLIPWTCLPQAHLGVFQICLLATNSSGLRWGRVAMPLISPLMPVPQCLSPVLYNIFHTSMARYSLFVLHVT